MGRSGGTAGTTVGYAKDGGNNYGGYPSDFQVLETFKAEGLVDSMVAEEVLI